MCPPHTLLVGGPACDAATQAIMAGVIVTGTLDRFLQFTSPLRPIDVDLVTGRRHRSFFMPEDPRAVTWDDEVCGVWGVLCGVWCVVWCAWLISQSGVAGVQRRRARHPAHVHPARTARPGPVRAAAVRGIASVMM